jgi:transcriptional regulator with XRE-family HTH domain
MGLNTAKRCSGTSIVGTNGGRTQPESPFAITPGVELEERRRIGGRITRARKESGLTQRELGELLGITTRSIQNYESGAIVPWRHLSRIEVLTRKRAGWLLRGEHQGGALEDTIASLLRTMEQHHKLLAEHLRLLTRNTERLREQREARRERHRVPVDSG